MRLWHGIRIWILAAAVVAVASQAVLCPASCAGEMKAGDGMSSMAMAAGGRRSMIHTLAAQADSSCDNCLQLGEPGMKTAAGTVLLRRLFWRGGTTSASSLPQPIEAARLLDPGAGRPPGGSLASPPPELSLQTSFLRI